MSPVNASDAFSTWLDALQTRHGGTLAFAEVTRGLRALSSAYVERRVSIGSRSPLDGAGKRAAFALFYGPLHWLVVDHVARSLELNRHQFRYVIDLGCGTGAAGAAFTSASAPTARLTGIDKNPWAVEEARWTYRTAGLSGTAIRTEISRARLSAASTAIIAAFSVNELAEPDRNRLLSDLMRAADHGAALFIAEPIARTVSPWWNSWSVQFTQRGGRADEWRFPVELPEPIRRLDQAAGLDHQTLTGKSLWLPPGLSAPRDLRSIDRQAP
jgi:SAM-dependent methyltransferase